jgi:hypothetical protein
MIFTQIKVIFIYFTWLQIESKIKILKNSKLSKFPNRFEFIF